MDEVRPLVLVTGATGFLGSHLVPALLAANYLVAAITRKPIDQMPLNPPGLQWVSLAESLPFVASRRPAAIVHLATDYGRASEADLHQTNVLWPLALLAQMPGGGLFINTDTFFGKPDFAYQHMRPYIESKDEFWAKARSCAGENVKCLSLRLEHVFGEKDLPQKFVPFLIGSLLQSDQPVDMTAGDQKRDMLYAGDAAEAYVTALKFGLSQAFEAQEWEIGTGNSIGIRSFAEAVADACGAPRERLRFGALPHRPGEIMESHARAGALRKLGWCPRYSLHDAIQRTVDSYRDR